MEIKRNGSQPSGTKGSNLTVISVPSDGDETHSFAKKQECVR